MSFNLSYSKSFRFWLLALPVIAFFYVGLFLTMQLWYPSGLPSDEWQAHIVNFSVIYLIWLVVFYANRLFELGSFRSISSMLIRLGGVFVLCGVAAVVYFYFQPTFLLTPRRFLVAHVFVSGFLTALWYIFAQKLFPYTWRRLVFSHSSFNDSDDLQKLLDSNPYAGLKYEGTIDSQQIQQMQQNYFNAVVVFPRKVNLETDDLKNLFNLRRHGVRFVEYHELYEKVSRQVHLHALTELWFIDSVDYGAHKLFDILKKIIDVILGCIGFAVFLITAPLVALAIKITSYGPIFFKQQRVGQYGKIFTLYKYRTMSTPAAHGGTDDTWTAPKDKRITSVGKVLRSLRLDELPQSLNILKGDMSIVGPRPEQVNIVKDLEQQIPYYDERHIVKPGLTGWAQLHVYAGNLEETKRKLQYDLYYIKHRSLLFDAEIILKTVYNIITFGGGN